MHIKTKHETKEKENNKENKTLMMNSNILPLDNHEDSLRSTNSNLQLCNLSSWGLPESILVKYQERGVSKMFPWQVECLQNKKVLENNANLVYSAPTSAGKTLIAEILCIKTIIERKKNVIMILPFVSVVREKMFYFQDILSGAGIRVAGFMGSHNPPGKIQEINMAICTIEKANNLINKMLEDQTVNNLGAIVVDELHLLGDPHRGYLLELLLTKLLYTTIKNKQLQLQIIGMSATLPNLDMLAFWLKAELYKTDFRPIPLNEYCHIQGNIYDNNFKLKRVINTHEDLPNDCDNIIQLCLETITSSCSVLIFCPSKNQCENLGKQIAKEFHRLGNSKSQLGAELRKKLDTEAIMELLEQLKMCPVGLDTILKMTVSFGVAFHHAGLTIDERDIIEAAFRKCAIRVLISTTTLSSGVNLPARRVIIRSPLFGSFPIDTLSYRQMIGRAGRMGKDTEGESILLCQKKDENVVKKLMSSVLKPISSCLEESGRLKRAFLEVIAGGFATSPEDLAIFTKCTLYAVTDRADVLEDPIETTIDFLKRNEFIRLQKNSCGELHYIATSLSKACLYSSLPPEEGLTLFAELEKARQCFVLESELHIVYIVTPYSVCNQWNNLDWSNYLNIYSQLPQCDRRIADLVGISESFIMQALMGRVDNSKSYSKLQVHRRFYTALALYELVQEIPLISVAEKYMCVRGLLQSLQQSASTFAGMVTAFCRQLGWHSVEILVSQFQDRLQFGVNRDLLDLMQLPLLNSLRARALFNAGIETIIGLASVDVCEVENALHKVLPFQTTKERDGETSYDANKRNQLKTVWVTGKAGLTEREAAEMLVKEARRYLQYKMGLEYIDWESNNNKSSSSILLNSRSNKSNISIKDTSNMLEKSKSSPFLKNMNEMKMSVNKSKINKNVEYIASRTRSKTSQEMKLTKTNSSIKKVSNKNSSTVVNEKSLNICFSLSPTNITNVKLNKNKKSPNVKSNFPNEKETSDLFSISSDDFQEIKTDQFNLSASKQLSDKITTELTNDRKRKSDSFSMSSFNFTDIEIDKFKLSEPISSPEKKTKTISSQTEHNIDELRKSDSFSMSSFNLTDIEIDKFKLSEPISSPEKKIKTISSQTEHNIDELRNSDFFSKSSFNVAHTKIDSTELEVQQKQTDDSINNSNSFCMSSLVLSDTEEDKFNLLNTNILEKRRTSNRFSFSSINSIDIEDINKYEKNLPCISPNIKECSSIRGLESLNNTESLFSESFRSETNVDVINHTQNNFYLKDTLDEAIFDVETDENNININNLSITVEKDLNDSVKSINKSFVDLSHELKNGSLNNSNDIIAASQDSGVDVNNPTLITKLKSFIEKSNSCKKTRKHKKNLNVINNSNTSHLNRNEINSLQITDLSFTLKNIENSPADFSKVEIINVCDDRNLFELCKKRLLKESMMSLNLNCEYYENKTVIGIKSINKKRKQLEDKYIYNQTKPNGFSICCGGNTAYNFNFFNDKVSIESVIDLLKNILTQKNNIIRQFDCKEHLKLIYKCFNIIPECKFEDPKTADWLLSSENKEKNLHAMALHYAPETVELVQLAGNCKGLGSVALNINSNICSRTRGCVESIITWHITTVQKEVLKDLDTRFLNVFEIEMASLVNLSQMEVTGIRISKEKLQQIGTTLEMYKKRIEEKAYLIANRRFLFSSSIDVAKVLGMYQGKKVKTNKKVLSKCENPLSALILSWRHIDSKLNKFIFPLLACETDSSRIKGCYMTHTATGRIVMNEPSLQMIPRNFEVLVNDESYHVSIRSVFVPSDNYVLLSADYCQLELRILTHFCQDVSLCEIMRSNKDIFKSIAANWNKISDSEVSEELRQKTKQLCYGIIYGMSSKTLSEQLKIEEVEATDLIETFKIAYPNIQKYCNEVITKCRNDGYVETVYGRRRYLHQINHTMPYLKSQAERQAINTTIQGSAADIVKRAMIRIDSKLNKKYSAESSKIAVPVLHLHDEMIYEVLVSELHNVARLVKEAMENISISVPCPIKLKLGKSWGELEDFKL